MRWGDSWGSPSLIMLSDDSACNASELCPPTCERHAGIILPKCEDYAGITLPTCRQSVAPLYLWLLIIDCAAMPLTDWVGSSCAVVHTLSRLPGEGFCWGCAPQLGVMGWIPAVDFMPTMKKLNFTNPVYCGPETPSTPSSCGQPVWASKECHNH